MLGPPPTSPQGSHVAICPETQRWVALEYQDMRRGSRREQVQDVEAQEAEYLQQANQTGPDGSLLAEKPNTTKKNEKKKTNKPCHRRTNQIGR